MVLLACLSSRNESICTDISHVCYPSPDNLSLLHLLYSSLFFPCLVITLTISVQRSGCTSGSVMVELLRLFVSVLLSGVSAVRRTMTLGMCRHWCGAKMGNCEKGCELTVTAYCVIRFPCKREPGWSLYTHLDHLFYGSLPDKDGGFCSS